jgi:hypothetical protein
MADQARCAQCRNRKSGGAPHRFLRRRGSRAHERKSLPMRCL